MSAFTIFPLALRAGLSARVQDSKALTELIVDDNHDGAGGVSEVGACSGKKLLLSRARIGGKADGDSDELPEDVVRDGDGCCFSDTLVVGDDVLDLGRRNLGEWSDRIVRSGLFSTHVLAAADDNVLGTVREVEEPVSVDIANVAGVEPHVLVEYLGGGLCERSDCVLIRSVDSLALL